MTNTNDAAWWRRTRGTAATTLIFMALATTAAFFASDAPDSAIFNLPLRSFLISLMVPIAVVIAIFLFARRQESIDRRFDVSED